MAKKYLWLMVALLFGLAAYAAPGLAHDWHGVDFASRPLYAYPLPAGRDDLIGSLTTYTIQKGDTLLDVGRWFGLSAKEISDANGHIDWWLPPAGREIILPTEHILPDTGRTGIILNVPEMRLYYYFPSPAYARHKRGKLTPAAYSGARVVYTFPVGLGRFDWKTPLGVWRVTAKVKNPTWTMPEDIYQEHVERDGFADRFVPAGPDNPLGMYKLDLSIPQYGLHGTNVPWGIGMTVSHGCVRLYPEDIERLFSKTPVGTPGEFVYQPVKFGWRGGVLYAEVHDDLYGKYPGLWNLAAKEVRQRNLTGQVDMDKLEKLVEAKSGIPTYVGLGPTPASAALPLLTASDGSAPDTSASTSSGAPASIMAPSAADAPSAALGPSTTLGPSTAIGPSDSTGTPTTAGTAASDDASTTYGSSSANDDSAAGEPPAGGSSAPPSSAGAEPSASDDNAAANEPPTRADTAIVTGSSTTVHRSTTIGTATVPATTAPAGFGLPTSIVKSPDDDNDAGGDWESSGRTNP